MDKTLTAQGALDGLRQGFSWWVGELAACVPARLKRLARARRAELRLTRQRISLRRDGRAVTGAEWARSQIAVQDMAPFLRNASLQIRVEEGAFLVQRLSLPASVQASLQSALAFEVDRRTPFRAADVLIGYRLLPRQDGARTLTVDMVCLPKRVIAPVLDAITAAGARAASLQAELDGEQVDLPLAAGPAIPPRTKRLHAAGWAGAAAALAIAVIVPVQRVERLAEEMEAQLAQLRVTAGRTAQMEERLQADAALQSTVQEFRARVTALAALAELTRVVEDATHVTSLRFTTGSVEVQAEGGSAAVVARDIEDSPLFAATALRGPVVPAPDGGDQFGLVAQIEAQTSKVAHGNR